jgi:hypothetical protein
VIKCHSGNINYVALWAVVFVALARDKKPIQVHTILYCLQKEDNTTISRKVISLPARASSLYWLSLAWDLYNESQYISMPACVNFS